MLFLLLEFPIGSRLFIPGMEFSVVVAAEFSALPSVVVLDSRAPIALLNAEFAADAIVDVLSVAKS